MAFGGSGDNYTDDMFAESRMSFGDHIEVLRIHLWKAIIGLLIAVCVSFAFAQPVLEFIAAPVEKALVRVYEKRLREAEKKLHEGDAQMNDLNQPTNMDLILPRLEMARALGLPTDKINAEETFEITAQIKPAAMIIATEKARRSIGQPPRLAAMSVTEGFLVYIKVSFYCGIILSSWWIFYQIWSFVAAGLYPHEKRLVNVYLPVSVILFLVGVSLCEFIVLPKAVEYLLAFNEWLDLEPDLRLTEWLNFAIMMPLVFGIAFQTPLIMLFLEQLGIVSIDTYRRKRRLAFFILIIAGALILPTPDLFSFSVMTIALWSLYELGILFCRYMPRPALLPPEMPEPEEMVEV